MNERVELLNGKMDIESARGQGTKITISIPVSTDL
jgi:Signal transduction histidine kinase